MTERSLPLNRIPLLAIILASTAGLAAHAVSPPRSRATAQREPLQLVVTQLPVGTAAEKAGPRSGGMLPAAWGEGARLVLVVEGRMTKVLTPDFHSAADPDVSLDGTHILFAGQKTAGDHWAIFEMAADGRSVREVYAADHDLRHPIYLPTLYTIIPDPTKGTEPREHIGFVQTFSGSRNEYGDAPTSALYSVKLDGSDPRRLTYNLSNERDPVVLRDGRVIYSAWQRANLDRGFEGRISLLGINADGVDPAIFAADEGQRIKAMPCATPTSDRLVIFVESESVGWDGAGTLASVSLRRNLHSYRPIPVEGQALYHSPSELADGRIVASRRPSDGSGSHAIVRLDPTTGKVEAIFDDPERHDMQPRALAPRLHPDHRSSAVKDPDAGGGATAGPPLGALDAELYGLNVYANDLGVDLPAGAIAKLRIIEGLRGRGSVGPWPALLDPPIPGASVRGVPPLAQRRLVGEAPVEQDGSFHVRVPAEVPLQLQILDQDGLALRSSGWIWVHYKGRQGCVGCHEDGELTPRNRFVDALGKPMAELVQPPERRRTVDFKHDVAPIVAARCAACHGAGKSVRLAASGQEEDAARRAYETLLVGLKPASDGRVRGRFVDPGSARTSPVVWHVFGRSTARPWDEPDRTREVKPMGGGHELSAEERQTFIEWIDLGAPWEASSVTSTTTGGAQ